MSSNIHFLRAAPTIPARRVVRLAPREVYVSPFRNLPTPPMKPATRPDGAPKTKPAVNTQASLALTRAPPRGTLSFVEATAAHPKTRPKMRRTTTYCTVYCTNTKGR